MFKLTKDQIKKIIDSLDQTGGLVIKESELRYWIEYFVNKDRKCGCQNPGKEF